MSDQTLPRTRPNTAAELAARLHAIAEQIATLGEAPLPDVYVGIDIQPHGGEDAEVAAIDLLGQALYGKPGQTRRMSDGSYHHSVTGHVGGISVDAYTRVTGPEERTQAAEIARLRAEVQALRAGQAGAR